MNGSRVRFLEGNLAILHYNMAYKALILVQKEMCIEKGFTRHNGKHYYFHLVDVAQKLLNAGVREENIITAALLHDIVEDVPGYTFEKIEKMFNKEVSYMVELLTKNPNIDYKKDKKELVKYLERISSHYGASLIKCSDRVHNMGTLLEATLEKRLRQALETEEFFLPFFKYCRNLYPWYAAFFFEAKTTVETQIELIKNNHEETEKLKNEINELKKLVKKQK